MQAIDKNSKQAGIDIINELISLTKTNGPAAVATQNSVELIAAVKELAESKKYVRAQYYLAKYFFKINDIRNYKFWLMQAASNITPHPLANIEVVKFCLKQHSEFKNSKPAIAANYLTIAQQRLQFIMNFPESAGPSDWPNIKRQAADIWQNEFTHTVTKAEVWSKPSDQRKKFKIAKIILLQKLQLAYQKLKDRIKDYLDDEIKCGEI